MPVNDSIFTRTIGKWPVLSAALCALWLSPFSSAMAQEEQTVCFESRETASRVTQTELGEDLPNVKCSDTTGGVLWWGDPFDGTVPLGDMPIEADYTHGEAVVKPRTEPANRRSTSNGARPRRLDCRATSSGSGARSASTSPSRSPTAQNSFHTASPLCRHGYIEHADENRKLLTHIDAKSATPVNHLQKSRAPPREGLFTSE